MNLNNYFACVHMSELRKKIDVNVSGSDIVAFNKFSKHGAIADLN